MVEKLNVTGSGRYRIYPNASQKRQIDITLDAKRFVYNYFLTVAKQHLDTGLFPGRYEMQGRLPTLKEEYPWLKEADSVALQIAVQHLSRAFRDYDKRKRYGLPAKLHFKHRTAYTQSYRRANGHNHVAIVGDKVKISKLGLVPIRLSQPISGRIIAATVTRVGLGQDARYYVSFCCETDNQPFLPKTGRSVGIDLGLETFAVTTDDEKFYMPDFKPQYERLDKLYDRLRQQEQGSEPWEKTCNRIMRVKEKISNKRTDFFQKLSLELVRRYDVICVESLDTRSMIKKKPRMKHAIQRAAFSEFIRILEYKCAKYGRQLVKVDGFYPSSQICSACGYRNEDVKDLKVRTWTCPVCNTTHDRDENAAVNILNEGLRLLEQETVA